MVRKEFSASDEAIYRVAIQQMQREDDWLQVMAAHSDWRVSHQGEPEPLVWPDEPLTIGALARALLAPASAAPEAR